MRVVLLSDLHVGSRWALADPSETPKSGQGRPIQAALYEAWKEAALGDWHAPDALVICGDAVEGQARKDAGTVVWSTDAADQVSMCVELVRMWAARRIYVIGGSKYHVALGDTGMSAEEMLGRQLGAEVYPGQDHIEPEWRRRSGPHWFLTFEKSTVHFAHHISVSRVFAYMSTPIAREMMQLTLNDPMRAFVQSQWGRMYEKHPASRQEFASWLESLPPSKTSTVVRGHAHYYWRCETGGSTGIILPSWKAMDPFISRLNPLGFTHVGWVSAEFNGDRQEYARHLWRIEDIQPPPHTVVPVEIGKRNGSKKPKARR